MSDKPVGYTVSWCCPKCGSFEYDKDTKGLVFDTLECSECDYLAELTPVEETND